jgi:type IV pilus assembly protein PilV
MRTVKGFTLLEFLITLLIVSFALLGIAALIGSSLKYNQSAGYRSEAVILAGDIIDRMRANRAAAEGANPSPYTLGIATTTPVCTAASTVATCDLNAWRSELATSFPSGTGSVALDAATNKVTVVVRWNDSRVERTINPQAVNVEKTVTIETRL